MSVNIQNLLLIWNTLLFYFPSNKSTLYHIIFPLKPPIPLLVALPPDPQPPANSQDFHSCFKPWTEGIKAEEQMHSPCSFSLFLLFFVPYKGPQDHIHKHTCMQTGVTKPWRGRVRFIAHLGWVDQWQSAWSKSLPQTELNKLTGSVYTGPDNPLIHITFF